MAKLDVPIVAEIIIILRQLYFVFSRLGLKHQKLKQMTSKLLFFKRFEVQFL